MIKNELCKLNQREEEQWAHGFTASNRMCDQRTNNGEVWGLVPRIRSALFLDGARFS